MAGNSINPTTMDSSGRPIAGYAQGGFNAQGQWQQKPDRAPTTPSPATSPGASYGQQAATATSTAGPATQAPLIPGQQQSMTLLGPQGAPAYPSPTHAPSARQQNQPMQRGSFQSQPGPIDAIQGLDQRQFARPGMASPRAIAPTDNPVTPPPDDSLMPLDQPQEYGIPHAQRQIRPSVVRA